MIFALICFDVLAQTLKTLILAKVGLAKVGQAIFWPKSVNSGWPKSVKIFLAKVGLAKVGLAKVCQIRMAKVGLAKVGRNPLDTQLNFSCAQLTCHELSLWLMRSQSHPCPEKLFITLVSGSWLMVWTFFAPVAWGLPFQSGGFGCISSFLLTCLSCSKVVNGSLFHFDCRA